VPRLKGLSTLIGRRISPACGIGSPLSTRKSRSANADDVHIASVGGDEIPVT
jgi:hypothetical protein